MVQQISKKRKFMVEGGTDCMNMYLKSNSRNLQRGAVELKIIRCYKIIVD
jgi:hypothetical protein